MVENHYNINTDNVKYKRTIVTVTTKINKKATYMPNDKAVMLNGFHTETVRVRNNEALVYLGALLR
ncbi:Uncharacterized protein dnl_31360 [Desulfonema limicola]|uniref:Uncharacterized protein n=1 Tax=Desulfonema limicola TaxID=45656 RepID=A0A975B8J1_9BACT|nr:hypothetical protein [Desulfonema limicola]QTA80823.1 Uncharacterized protein dnl_31360 [Desulfonema limicola]